jgi:NADPH-dependent 2,4-dienoyl-CoA reductase/sulfur reductase-like enzyme
MTAALMLDQAGFAVTLYEKRGRLGGNLITSATPPNKEKLFWYNDFLQRRIAGSQVEVRTGTWVDAAMLTADTPDVVILANGSRLAPLPLEIRGNLPTAPAYEALIGDIDLPPSSAERPIVVFGGGETGTETAEYLAEQGHQVLLVSRSDASLLARNAEPLYRMHLLRRLKENSAIRILDRTDLAAIDGDHVVLSKGGEAIIQPATAILLAHGLVSDADLAGSLAGLGAPVIRIGDAAQVARIGEAVRDAYRAVQDLRRLITGSEPIAC